MKKCTKIMVELKLSFAEEIDVYSLSEKIGLSPTRLKNKSEIKRNLFNEEQLPAVWFINTGYVQNSDLEEVANVFFAKIQPHFEAIKKVLQDYKGMAHFCIVPEIIRNDKPSLFFNKIFLDSIHYLDATVDIDMYFYG